MTSIISGLPTSEYVTRRERLYDILSDSLLITATKSKKRNGDSEYPYRQDSWLLYFTGIDKPHCAAVFDPKKRQCTVYVKKTTEQETIWTGDQRCARTWSLLYGVTVIEDAVLPIIRQIKNLNQDELNALLTLRLHKSPAELTLMKKAALITLDMFSKLQIRDSEQYVKAQIDYAFAKANCEHAYTPIVTQAGCILHNNSYKNTLVQDRMLLVDAGAEYCYYASDYSRTFTTSAVSTIQRSILDAVKKIHDDLVAYIKAGQTLQDINNHMFALLQEQLSTLKINIDPKKICPHGFGHAIGLDVHDCGDIESRDFFKTYKLQEGFTFTIEPGIYFQQTMNVPQEYKKISGIRYENTYVLTSQGVRHIIE